MITGFLLGLVAKLFGALVSIIPLPSVPDWLTDTGGPIAKVFAGAQHLGSWFPVQLVTTVILGVLAINLVGFFIKLSRIAVSLFTGGGGGAG